MKVRGHRVELGEVEHVLTACRLVQQAVVVVRAEELAAYVTLGSPAREASIADAIAYIRSHISHTLTSYMMPRCGMFSNTGLLSLTYSPSGTCNCHTGP